MIDELKRLGQSHSEAVEAAYKVAIARLASLLLLCILLDSLSVINSTMFKIPFHKNSHREDSLFILMGFSDSPFKLVILVLPLLGDDSVFIVFIIELTFNVRCEHENSKSADACLMEVIGEKNPEHFFVATQDADLRKKLQEVRIVFFIFCCSSIALGILLVEHHGFLNSCYLWQVPGVPLIFGLRNALLLEPPSAFQRQFVKTSEEARSRMNESEFKKLKKSTNILETKEIGDSSNKNEELENQKLEMQADKKTHYARKGMGVKDRPQFKRKRAKV